MSVLGTTARTSRPATAYVRRAIADSPRRRLYVYATVGVIRSVAKAPHLTMQVHFWYEINPRRVLDALRELHRKYERGSRPYNITCGEWVYT